MKKCTVNTCASCEPNGKCASGRNPEECPNKIILDLMKRIDDQDIKIAKLEQLVCPD